jgi:hypothetical protein
VRIFRSEDFVWMNCHLLQQNLSVFGLNT